MKELNSWLRFMVLRVEQFPTWWCWRDVDDFLFLRSKEAVLSHLETSFVYLYYNMHSAHSLLVGFLVYLESSLSFQMI